MSAPSVCNRCGGEYEQRKFWQRFCSTRCRMAAAGAERKAAVEAHRVRLAEVMVMPPPVGAST